VAEEQVLRPRPHGGAGPPPLAVLGGGVGPGPARRGADGDVAHERHVVGELLLEGPLGHQPRVDDDAVEVGEGDGVGQVLEVIDVLSARTVMEMDPLSKKKKNVVQVYNII
jgi:hypothetical protein